MIINIAVNTFYNNFKLLPGSILTDIDPVTKEFTDKFMTSDTRDLYVKNKKKYPTKFLNQKNTEISYKLNSNGYRAPEWEDIDWQNSIVIFGCSTVFGIGLSEEDTISYKLQKLSGIPVINLGVPGSGITFTLHNSLQLFENFGIPRAVISIWSSLQRIHIYREKQIYHHGVWSDKSKDSFFYHWGVESTVNCESHNYFNAKINKELWSSKTQYIDGSLFNDTAKLLNCHFFPTTDAGRDLMHPGPITTDNVACYLHKNLK
jgi:hypothetical protein